MRNELDRPVWVVMAPLLSVLVLAPTIVNHDHGVLKARRIHHSECSDERVKADDAARIVLSTVTLTSRVRRHDVALLLAIEQFLPHFIPHCFAGVDVKRPVV